MTFKIKSVLKGSECEISKQDLIGWLQHEIAEQKRVDASTSGIAAVPEAGLGSLLPKEHSSNVDVQLLLPGETKKQRRQTKSLFLDRGASLFYVAQRTWLNIRASRCPARAP